MVLATTSHQGDRQKRIARRGGMDHTFVINCRLKEFPLHRNGKGKGFLGLFTPGGRSALDPGLPSCRPDRDLNRLYLEIAFSILRFSMGALCVKQTLTLKTSLRRFDEWTRRIEFK